MIPDLRDVRYVGTDNFTVGVARSVVTALYGGVSRTISAGSAHADYSLLVSEVGRYVKIMHLEPDEDLNPLVVQALTKYWVKIAWGKDLLCDPRTNGPMIWKINAKDAVYENRDIILPGGEATALGGFDEYRPYGSIPGEWRLIRGQNNWWVTYGGTHGGRAACRIAPWWVWPLNRKEWLKWTIPGHGAGFEGTPVPLPHDAQLPAMTTHDKYLIKLMKANFDNAMEDPQFTSKVLFRDSMIMQEFW